MEPTEMFSELMQLGADWTEGSGWRKTSSCETCNQSLNKLATNDQHVVFYDVGDLGVLWQ